MSAPSHAHMRWQAAARRQTVRAIAQVGRPTGRTGLVAVVLADVGAGGRRRLGDGTEQSSQSLLTALVAGGGDGGDAERDERQQADQQRRLLTVAIITAAARRRRPRRLYTTHTHTHVYTASTPCTRHTCTVHRQQTASAVSASQSDITTAALEMPLDW